MNMNLLNIGDLVRYKNPSRFMHREPHKFEIGLVIGHRQGLPLVAFPSYTGTVASIHVEIL
jgi:hypothetical protein